MPSLPLVVIAEARSLAWRCGIDDPSALSLTAEAWSDHPDPLWRTVAHRRCVDERRRLSGRNGPDRRPLPILDEPCRTDDGTSATLGELIACDERGFPEIEARCDLADLIGELPDDELAQLARHYWLGMTEGKNTPRAVTLMRALRHARAQAAAAAIHAPSPPPPDDCPLTSRERQVVAAAADGLTVEAIGRRLNLSGYTIKTHLARITKRVGARNTTHVVTLALRAGWIT